jgi:hypothetical protein
LVFTIGELSVLTSAQEVRTWAAGDPLAHDQSGAYRAPVVPEPRAALGSELVDGPPTRPSDGRATVERPIPPTSQ